MSAEERDPLLVNDLRYRREKQWKIFTWAGGILTAIAAGLVALKANTQAHFTFDVWRCVVLTLVVSVLTIYATRWIRYNLSEEQRLAGLLRLNTGAPPRYGYGLALWLLALAALAAVWLPTGG